MAQSARTPTSCASPASRGLGAAAHWAAVVQRENACALPGVDIKYDTFMKCMWRAVDRGYVRREHAEFCAEGLRHGFTCGIDGTKLKGRRYYRNYPTGFTARSNRTCGACATG